MRYEKIVSGICLIAFLSFQSIAPLEATFYWENPRPGFHHEQFKNGEFYIYLPADYDQEKQYPLVVLSHIYLGEPEIDAHRFMESWISLADQRNYIVVMPMAGGDPRFTDAWYKDLLESLRESYAIDSSRVLLTGFGAGAHYALHFGASYPQLFRAVSPIAGTLEGYWKEMTSYPGGNRPDFYFLCGAEDRQVPPQAVREVADMMSEMRYHVKFEEIEGIDHSYSDEFTLKIADWFDGLPKDEH